MSPSIETVHLIFKTHLDLGFTDYARTVMRRYFDEYIPAAIHLARALRDSGAVERFVWTTGSWVIYEFLEQASSDARRQMEDAIANGDVVWHALPFTTHTELMDPELFRFGLSLARRLDARFGRQTIAAKMTDVPGHTRGMVPLLAEAGIEFLHIGVNESATVPEVPPLFTWHDQPSDTRLMVMYHTTYGSVTPIEQIKAAIAVTLTGDNLGPPTQEMVRQQYRQLSERFVNARIMASTLDAFARELRSVRHDLPVVTQEIGDSWIHGAGTDPTKVSRYRELARMRRRWLEDGEVQSESQSFFNFSKALLLIPEHTWGMDEKTHLPDHESYSLEALRIVRHRLDFQRFEASWTEQRAYVDDAVAALTDTQLQTSAASALAGLTPIYPDLSSYESFDPQRLLATAHLNLKFDPQSGAIAYLQTTPDGRLWSDPEHVFGLLRYETFSQADYDRYWDQYVRNKTNPDVRWWAIEDLTKPGIEGVARKQRFILPRLRALHYRQNDEADQFVAELELPESVRSEFGTPGRIVLRVDCPKAFPGLLIELLWFDKLACRLPEAFWLSFVPRQYAGARWMFDKMGTLISPAEVVSGGGRRLHAVQESIWYEDRESSYQLRTLDVPLVAPGTPSLLDFSNVLPDLEQGVHFNLYNNVWGTNFPMWFDDDARFRFEVRFGVPPP